MTYTSNICIYIYIMHTQHIWNYRRCTRYTNNILEFFYTFNSTPSCHYLKKSVDSMRSHMGGKSSPAKNQCSLAELYGAVASQDVDCQVSVLFVRRFAHAIFQLLYISIYKLKLSLSSMICSCICRTVFLFYALIHDVYTQFLFIGRADGLIRSDSHVKSLIVKSHWPNIGFLRVFQREVGDRQKWARNGPSHTLNNSTKWATEKKNLDTSHEILVV